MRDWHVTNTARGFKKAWTLTGALFLCATQLQPASPMGWFLFVKECVASGYPRIR